MSDEPLHRRDSRSVCTDDCPACAARRAWEDGYLACQDGAHQQDDNPYSAAHDLLHDHDTIGIVNGCPACTQVRAVVPALESEHDYGYYPEN